MIPQLRAVSAVPAIHASHFPCAASKTVIHCIAGMSLALTHQQVRALARPPNFKQEKQRREDKQRKKNEEKQRKIAERKENASQPPKP